MKFNQPSAIVKFELMELQIQVEEFFIRAIVPLYVFKRHLKRH